MTEWYRNKGAPFLREDGTTTVQTGETFAPTARELAQRRLKLQRVWRNESVDPVPSPPPRTPAPAGWPLRMAPELYLELYPSGPHATLAQKLVESAKEVTGGADD